LKQVGAAPIYCPHKIFTRLDSSCFDLSLFLKAPYLKFLPGVAELHSHRISVSQSVSHQTGTKGLPPFSTFVLFRKSPHKFFNRCGRATLTPVLEYLVTEPPLKSDGTPRYAAPAAKVMLSMDPRWYCTRLLMHIHQQGLRVRKPKNVTQFNCSNNKNNSQLTKEHSRQEH
jgi:hypothetical protein